MLRAALLVLTLVWVTGCSETPKAASTAAGTPAADAATEQLLNDMEGVWRPTDPEQRGLVYVLRDGHNLRLLYGGVYETDVQLRSVDVKAQSVNLSVAAAGGRVIWTLRKVPGPANEEPGYGLLVTMNGGEQQDLALVRRVSPEDREFMAGELARAIREESSEAEVEAEVEADVATEEEAPAAEAVAEAVSSDDVKVSKAHLADDAEAAAVPAPVYPTSFDCTQATGSAEVAVCYDAELADLDQKLARAYRKVLAQSDQPEAERSTQMRWLRDKRNACEEDVACLRRVYLNRLKYFAGPPYHAYSERAE